MFGAVWLDVGLAGFLGLIVGSFLNVVIHRLPIVMARQWAQECQDYLTEQGVDQKDLQKLLSTHAANAAAATNPLPDASAASAETFNLIRPRSRCPHCGHAIAWWENIPLLSYALLRGKCSACGARISLRYPLVELATGLLFAYSIWRFGVTPNGLVWCGFCAALLALALIDWDTTLLPDSITLPLLWTALIGAALGWTGVPLAAALWGAVAGYLSLWSIYWAFKLLTGKDGMGFGDFKLFAALGAWFGWAALVPMILLASVIGAIVGIALKFGPGLREGGYVPFGPFLAGAGLTALVFGPQAIVRLVGL